MKTLNHIFLVFLCIGSCVYIQAAQAKKTFKITNGSKVRLFDIEVLYGKNDRVKSKLRQEGNFEVGATVEFPMRDQAGNSVYNIIFDDGNSDGQILSLSGGYSDILITNIIQASREKEPLRVFWELQPKGGAASAEQKGTAADLKQCQAELAKAKQQLRECQARLDEYECEPGA